MVIKMRNISKKAWQAAKEANETTLTFAAWRTEQKELAATAGEQVTTIDANIGQELVDEMTAMNAEANVADTSDMTDAEVADTNAGVELDTQMTGAAAGVDTADVSEVLSQVNAALDIVVSAKVQALIDTKASKSKIAQALFE